MKELTIEELTTEAMQLLPLGVDELYMVLGLSATRLREAKACGGDHKLSFSCQKSEAGEEPICNFTFQA
jgi:hypothetical protein